MRAVEAVAPVQAREGVSNTALGTAIDNVREGEEILCLGLTLAKPGEVVQ
ncbi:MAG: hypothetical protein P4L71_13990 [Acetobacteraceae bacterium]|nr:hypothetical protein [Acetobacteraceae bacterium]